MGGESLQAVLEPTERNQVKHFARTGTKNAALIVQTKSNMGEAVLKIGLRQQLELIGEALAHECVHFFGKAVGELRLRVTRQVRGALADATELFDLQKSGGVVTTQTVVTLRVTYDEWYIRVEHNGMQTSVVLQIPSEAMLLQSQKTGFFKDKVDLHVGLVEE